mgnify:CR=1 FL=1
MLFLNFSCFSRSKPSFFPLICRSAGYENCFLRLFFWASSVFFCQPFAKALSLVFYLESAIFYNKKCIFIWYKIEY